jgi:O-antigen ligase
MIPWEDSISITALGSLAKFIGLILAGFWLATMLIEGRFRKPHLFHILVFLFFLWNFVSIFWSFDIENTIQRTKTYSQVFLLMLIYWEVFQKPEDLMTGLQTYIFGSYVLIVSTIYNYIRGNVAVVYEGRYSATGVNANDLTLILLIGLPIAIQLFYVAEHSKKGTMLKLINIVYVPLAIYSIILTGSRTSLIAIIPFGLFIIGTQQITLGRKILVFVILLVALLALFPYIPDSVINRLGTIGSSIGEGDLGGRLQLWREAIVVLAQHPVLGIGGGAIVSNIGSAVHNTFISIAAETGIVGFMLFLSILGLACYQAVRLPKGTSGLWLTIFLTWVIGICSLSWEFRKITWLLLSFIVIEGNFTYEQLHHRWTKAEISKSIRRFSNVDDPLIKTEAGR